MNPRIARLIVALLVSATVRLQGQEFKFLSRTLQVHGFVSQGIVYTNDNNWLTMNTSSGSAAMTDMGLNVSLPLTDRLRIGAQVYDRNLGELGQWHPSLDWAVADYHFTSWLGLRGGKVKTVMGLYNDTQDFEFLHPFALLPQSIYQTDMRDCTVAHTGGDIYGGLSLGKGRGNLAYTAYVGRRQDSLYGGYPYLLKQPPVNIIFSSYGGLQYGGDVRWTTPLPGLLVGVSRMNEDITGDGTATFTGPVVPNHEYSKADWANQYYGQYKFRQFQFDAEYRRYWRDQIIQNGRGEIQNDVRGWYVAGAYRLAKRWQLASYFSRYFAANPIGVQPGIAPPESGKIDDKVITTRIDPNRFINVKLEGHFMAGTGVPTIYPSGFYLADNPQGLKSNTNALVVKTTLSF